MTVEILVLILVVFIFWVTVTSAGASDSCGGVAFIFGLLLLGASLILGAEVYETSIKSSCEETLPRNQECVIIAVPKDIEEK